MSLGPRVPFGESLNLGLPLPETWDGVDVTTLNVDCDSAGARVEISLEISASGGLSGDDSGGGDSVDVEASEERVEMAGEVSETGGQSEAETDVKVPDVGPDIRDVDSSLL